MLAILRLPKSEYLRLWRNLSPSNGIMKTLNSKELDPQRLEEASGAQNPEPSNRPNVRQALSKNLRREIILRFSSVCETTTQVSNPVTLMES